MQNHPTIDAIDLATNDGNDDRPIVTADGINDKIAEEPIKVSRHQRRKNKALRARFMRKITKKVKAVTSTRHQGKNDAVPIETKV